MKNWTTFEKVWLTVFTLINLFLFFVWDDTLIGLISSLSGMLCVVLVAKGKIANYYFGFVQIVTYVYIAMGYKLYGEAMLNAFFYLPIQFIGFYMWNKNLNKDSEMDINVKRLNIKQWGILIVLVIIASIVYAEFLSVIGGQQVRIDSLAVVISIFAQILMIKRYVEQWILWITVNVLTIILWIVTLTSTGGNDWSMLVMWSAFLFNSVYAYWKWSKEYSQQQGVK